MWQGRAGSVQGVSTANPHQEIHMGVTAKERENRVRSKAPKVQGGQDWVSRGGCVGAGFSDLFDFPAVL